MKKNLSFLLLLHCCVCGLSHATITVNTEFGILTTSDGMTPVPDGTLWMLVVDRNGDNFLPGGLEADSSLNVDSSVSQIANDFNNVTLSLGATIGGDVIFAMGGMNGGVFFGTEGISSDALTLGLGPTDALDINDVGRVFGFYWFPGINFDSDNPNVHLGALYEVGGVSTVSNIITGDPMIIPGDGTSINVSASSEELGGIISASALTAVAIPEPTTMMIAMLSALALFRRNRV